MCLLENGTQMWYNETENTFIIDTALLDDIASKDGKYVFEVNKDRII